MSAPFAVTPCASMVPRGSRTVSMVAGTTSRNSIQLIFARSRVVGVAAGGTAARTKRRASMTVRLPPPAREEGGRVLAAKRLEHPEEVVHARIADRRSGGHPRCRRERAGERPVVESFDVQGHQFAVRIAAHLGDA